jgi:hypothetical protein
MIREGGLNISRRMQSELGFNANVSGWQGFGSAGVPPAGLRLDTGTKIAGGTPALQNLGLYNKARDDRSDCSNRGEMQGLGE